LAHNEIYRWLFYGSGNKIREPHFRDSLLSYYIAENQKNDQERKVKGREAGDIRAGLARVVRHVLAEGDQTCERGNECAGAADVHAKQQLTVVVGELGEQNGAGDVTDDLAGQGAEDQHAAVEECGKEVADNVDAGHVARENEKANEGKEQGIVHLLQRLAVGKQQHGGDGDKANDIRNGAEDDGDGQHEQRQVKGGASAGEGLFLALGHLDTHLGHEQKAGGDDHHSCQQKGRGHDGDKFGIWNIKMGIEIQVLGIAEGGEHTAEVSGDVLHDKGEGHMLLLAGAGQDEKAERQKGQQRHVVGDEHRAEEGDHHQGKDRRAKVARCLDDAMRQNGKEADVFQRAYDSEGAKQTAERFEIQVGEISGIGRDDDGGDKGRHHGDAKHGVFADPAKQAGDNGQGMVTVMMPNASGGVGQLHKKASPFLNILRMTAHEQ